MHQFRREKRPVINVSWEDSVEYAAWLLKATGKTYRLPTDEEWVYTATSGGEEELWAGTSRKKELSDYAWYKTNSEGMTHPVGKKNSNGLRRHDMSGNVWEWVQDCYRKYRKRVDGGKFGRRGVRGGNWNSGPENLQTSHRGRNLADLQNYPIGFRLAQEIP